jgi:hypothetical protein
MVYGHCAGVRPGAIGVDMAARSHFPTHRSAEVIRFPRRPRGGTRWDDDYRGRMVVYGVLFIAAACFVAGGVWLATALNGVPRKPDCNFSRHRPCHNYPDDPVRLPGLPR